MNGCCTAYAMCSCVSQLHASWLLPHPDLTLESGYVQLFMSTSTRQANASVICTAIVTYSSSLCTCTWTLHYTQPAVVTVFRLHPARNTKLMTWRTLQVLIMSMVPLTHTEHGVGNGLYMLNRTTSNRATTTSSSSSSCYHSPPLARTVILQESSLRLQLHPNTLLCAVLQSSPALPMFTIQQQGA